MVTVVRRRMNKEVSVVEFKKQEVSKNCLCDAPFPGGPLTTRQPAETLMNVG